MLWFYQEGASILFPDKWEDFIEPIPKVERGDLMSAYYRRYICELNSLTHTHYTHTLHTHTHTHTHMDGG